LYILTYTDINAVDNHIYSKNSKNLLRELFFQSLPAFENEALLKSSSRRVSKENAIRNLTLFKEQSKLMQKKILSIASNQLFLKYKAEDIIKISLHAKGTEDFYYTIDNIDILTIRITRVVPLNLGFLLGKINFLSITSMGIYKLFDNKKFFEITFNDKLDESDIPFIEEIITNSFDMTKKIKIKKPDIKKDDIVIKCDHTDALAELKITTKDQKGLFSFIAKVFDEFNIEIQSAKIHSNRGKANDLLLIEKDGNFCKNQDKIIKALTI
jgi:[protein-PII] uridylyltransferase